MLIAYAFLYLGLFVTWKLLDLGEPDDGRPHFRISKEHALRERVRNALPTRELSLEDFRL